MNGRTALKIGKGIFDQARFIQIKTIATLSHHHVFGSIRWRARARKRQNLIHSHQDDGRDAVKRGALPAHGRRNSFRRQRRASLLMSLKHNSRSAGRFVPARWSELGTTPKAFDDGLELFAAADRMHLEAIVSKRRDAPYRSGKQCGWVKVNCATWREANKELWLLFERHC
jgi:hypothetical protein